MNSPLTAVAQAVDNFNANIHLQDGATVYIQAPTIELLARLVAKTKDQLVNIPQLPANPAVVAAYEEVEKRIAAREAQDATQVAQPVSHATESAKPAQSATGKSDSAQSAAEAAAADKPADASTPAEAVSYDDVKKVVTQLYSIKPAHATDLLAAFGVKKGTDLQPQQWPDVVAKGKAKLAYLGV